MMVLRGFATELPSRSALCSRIVQVGFAVKTVVAALFVNCRSRVYSNIVQAPRLTSVFTDTVSWSWMDMASDSGVFGQLLPLNGPQPVMTEVHTESENRFDGSFHTNSTLRCY